MPQELSEPQRQQRLLGRELEEDVAVDHSGGVDEENDI